MKIVHNPAPSLGLKLACVAGLFATQSALAGTSDNAPAATVMPGTVSMSAKQSFNLMGALSKELSPDEMRQVNDFLRSAVVATATSQPVVMTPALAQKLAQVRERMKSTQPEGAKSIDLMFGPQMEAALRKQAGSDAMNSHAQP